MLPTFRRLKLEYGMTCSRKQLQYAASYGTMSPGE